MSDFTDARDLAMRHGGWAFAVKAMLGLLRRRARNQRNWKRYIAKEANRQKRRAYERRYYALTREAGNGSPRVRAGNGPQTRL